MAQVFPIEQVIVPFEPPKQRLIFKVGDIIHMFSRPDRLYEIVSLETRSHGKEPNEYWEDIARLRKYVEVQKGGNCSDSRSRFGDVATSYLSANMQEFTNAYCIPYFYKPKYANTTEISKRPDPLVTKELILQYYDRNSSYTAFVTRKWYNANKPS